MHRDSSNTLTRLAPAARRRPLPEGEADLRLASARRRPLPGGEANGPAARLSAIQGFALLQGRTTLVILAGGGAVLHALNMFNSPSWLAAGQEGALVARAWSLLQGRELWGDLVTHAPGGVLLLSGWLAVMGGFG